METIAIDLTGELGEFALQRTAAHGLDSVSQYVCELIQADKRRAAKEAMEFEVLKGLHSGDSVPMGEQDWQEMRAEIASRYSSTNGK